METNTCKYQGAGLVRSVPLISSTLLCKHLYSGRGGGTKISPPKDLLSFYRPPRTPFDQPTIAHLLWLPIDLYLLFFFFFFLVFYSSSFGWSVGIGAFSQHQGSKDGGTDVYLSHPSNLLTPGKLHTYVRSYTRLNPSFLHPSIPLNLAGGGG